MNPVSRGLFVATLTLVLGTAVSLVAVRFGWIKQVSWPAAIFVPLVAGLIAALFGS